MNDKRYKTSLTLIILALCALSVQAQSGRRQTKPAPAAPVPTPTPEPTPTPKEDGDEKPELIFLVASDVQGGPESIPLVLHSAAQRGCADRLRARSGVEVDASQRDLGRGQAIDKAKSSSNTYVVLLTLKVDDVARSEIQLDFVVFAPQTAKVVTTGRSYVNSTRTGPIVLGPTSRLPSGMYREQWLIKAGEEAADRILKKMNMGGTVTK